MSKRILPVYQAIPATSLGASFNGAVTNIQSIDNVAVQLNCSGSPSGTFQIQGSLDYVPSPNTSTTSNEPTNAGNWTNIGASATISTSGTVLFNLTQLSFPWIRVAYTYTSGSGSVSGFVSGKAFGG